MLGIPSTGLGAGLGASTTGLGAGDSLETKR